MVEGTLITSCAHTEQHGDFDADPTPIGYVSRHRHTALNSYKETEPTANVEPSEGRFCLTKASVVPDKRSRRRAT